MTPDPNPVIAFLNELGRAMRDEQALAIVAYERREAGRKALAERFANADKDRAALLAQMVAADELTRLTDEMGLYRTDQEAS